jgi:hypothetical protein
MAKTGVTTPQREQYFPPVIWLRSLTCGLLLVLTMGISRYRQAVWHHNQRQS